MSFDAFMYFKGNNADQVKGETQDETMKEKNAFELLSFEFGAENNINIGSISAGGGAGKATFKEFNITKKTDTGSCGLFMCLVQGLHLEEAVIELRRSGQGDGSSGGTFMEFNFSMVMVQDISWSGSDGDDVCEEAVIFQYGAIKIIYTPQLTTGKMDTKNSKTAMWDRVKNKYTYAAAKS